MLEFVCVLIFAGCMSFAAAMDLFTMTIPNRVSIVLVVSFFVLSPFMGLSLYGMAMHTLAGAIMLGLAFYCFTRGWMGGGDAKILASISLWFGFANMGGFLLIAAVIGGVLTLGILMFRRLPVPAKLLEFHWINRLYDPTVGVPYGISLAISALWVFPMTQWITGFAN